MATKIAFLTNVHDYVGPPGVKALGDAGWTIFCHADNFTDPAERAKYEAGNRGTVAAASQDMAAFVAEGLERFGRIDALISNDLPKDIDRSLEASNPFANFARQIDLLLMEPARLVEAALPAMRTAGGGSILLVTSGSPLTNPSKAASFGYVAGRGGANALMHAMASALAPDGIQVNALAPYFVHSQFFFPAAEGEDADAKYASLLQDRIPMGRFGRPEEIGALLAFLVSGQAQFVSGQTIAFSGAGA